MPIENTEIETVDTGLPPDAVDTGSRSDGRDERRSIRESLEDGFARARGEGDEQPKEEKGKKGRFAPGGPRGKAEAATPGNTVPAEAAADPVDAPAETTDTPDLPAAPNAWTKEAKEAWAQVPEAARSAILKREKDVEEGVKKLQNYYSGIDRALAPHAQAIAAIGKTPEQTISHLFAWFNALATDPVRTAPELFKSLGYNPQTLAAIAQQIGGQPAQPAAPADVPEQQPWEPVLTQQAQALQGRIQQLEQQLMQRVGGLESTFQQQSYAKTQDVLGQWAKDKPYYEEVRVLMGQLLTPDPTTGLAAVPLKDGHVDLDTAYDMAVYANPTVRAKAYSTQQAAAKKAANEKAAAEAAAQTGLARTAARKNASITGSAPGAEAPKNPVKRGKSVKESLMEAIQEHSA